MAAGQQPDRAAKARPNSQEVFGSFFKKNSCLLPLAFQGHAERLALDCCLAKRLLAMTVMGTGSFDGSEDVVEEGWGVGEALEVRITQAVVVVELDGAEVLVGLDEELYGGFAGLGEFDGAD